MKQKFVFLSLLVMVSLMILLSACQTLSRISALRSTSSSPAPATSTPPSINPTPTPTVELIPEVTAQESAVNLRLGPGLNYEVVSVLAQGESLTIVGRNADSSWWLVNGPAGILWISAAVTLASNITDAIPIVSAPPTPTSLPVTPTLKPTNTSLPPPSTSTPIPPQYQYSIRNIFGQINEAITQIRGDIRDSQGNPINGVRVRVRSGSFCTVSYPSGPPGGYAPGGYDILLDNRAKDGQWQVAIVNGPADPTNTRCDDGLGVLSEEVTVPTNTLEGVTFVEWRKNF